MPRRTDIKLTEFAASSHALEGSRHKPRFQRAIRCLLAVAFGFFFTVPAAARNDTLRQQLRALASEHRFRIDGLNRVGPEPARPSEGDLVDGIPILLANYNYLITLGPRGKIESLTITSQKDPNAKPRYDSAITTTRIGNHHQVEAVLVGPNEQPVTATLIVDTGASMLVLPKAMIAQLGFTAEQLQTAQAQTASDTVPVRVGVLKSVQVGGVSAADVQVGFIAGKRLNGLNLLGMSFLSRFKFSLDDESNELSLIQK
jgi:aspartyl protease family protein